MAAEGGGPQADPEIGKLRWRCRRGMKELDVLLTRYVDEQYGQSTPAQKAAFHELLDTVDPVIYSYFIGRQPAPTDALSSLIDRITARPPNDRY